MKRLVAWFAALFGWDDPPRRSRDGIVTAVYDEHRRRIDEFNRALAAATHLRSLLQVRLDELQGKENRCQARLREAIQAGDEPSGAQLALELQNLQNDLTEIRQRFADADRNANQLSRLRDEAIARAQADVHDVSDLVERAAVADRVRPPK